MMEKLKALKLLTQALTMGIAGRNVTPEKYAEFRSLIQQAVNILKENK
jgi:hypothetical protein